MIAKSPARFSIPLPTRSRWRNVVVPVTAANGDASFPFMEAGAAWVAAGVPTAQRRVIAGQSHEFEAKVLGPELRTFFSQV